MKLGDKIYVVRRRSRYVASVIEGTVLACDVDAGLVGWHDENNLAYTTETANVFTTREAAEVHKEAVTR